LDNRKSHNPLKALKSNRALTLHLTVVEATESLLSKIEEEGRKEKRNQKTKRKGTRYQYIHPLEKTAFPAKQAEGDLDASRAAFSRPVPPESPRQRRYAVVFGIHQEHGNPLYGYC